jgi:hypothetical protein
MKCSPMKNTRTIYPTAKRIWYVIHIKILYLFIIERKCIMIFRIEGCRRNVDESASFWSLQEVCSCKDLLYLNYIWYSRMCITPNALKCVLKFRGPKTIGYWVKMDWVRIDCSCLGFLFSVALRSGPGLWPPLMGLRSHAHWPHHTR